MAPGTAVSIKISPNRGHNISCLLTPPDSADIVSDKSTTPPTFQKQQEPKVEPEVPHSGQCDDIVKRKIGGPAVDTGTQTDYDPVVLEARLILLDIWNLVRQRTEKSASSPSLRSSASSVMYRVACQLLDKHSIIYASIVKRLNLVDDDERIDYFAFRVVCDEVLDDGRGQRPELRQLNQQQLLDVSWGRIVALYALFIQVARDCHRRGLDRSAGIVADFVGLYVGERISSWITKQGGWIALERTFPAENHVEQKVWKGLLVTGLGLGMLATAIKAIR